MPALHTPATPLAPTSPALLQQVNTFTATLQEALDLYGAWRVIAAVRPKLPEPPLARAQWLLTLAHGAPGAREHAEQAQNALALLWGALRHGDAGVRAAAAAAAAQWPLDLVEELEAERPLRELCEVRCGYRGIVTSPRLHACGAVWNQLCEVGCSYRGAAEVSSHRDAMPLLPCANASVMQFFQVWSVPAGPESLLCSDRNAAAVGRPAQGC